MMDLRPRATPSASVTPTSDNGYRLQIPTGDEHAYRLAQLDDYAARPRSGFLWTAPTTLSLEARVSESSLPGTWGFGLWNDPFSVSFGLGGMARRLPALPNAAWFFFASNENYLSFRSDLSPSSGQGKPAQGFLAQTFSAPRMPSLLLASGAIALPLLMWQPASRLLRRVASHFISEDSARLSIDSTQWHAYQLEWSQKRVAFRVDEALVFQTDISPQGPLGLVIWIDNQFAAWTPDGKLRTGMLANSSAWLEIKNVVRYW